MTLLVACTLDGTNVSVVNAIVKLLNDCPVVSASQRISDECVADLATTVLSDRHFVTSHVDPENLTIWLLSSEIINPSTVTLIPDEAATLLASTQLGTDTPMVSAAVNEFTCQPVVITNRRSVQMPAGVRTQTALSDTHFVASLRLPPNRDGEL
jgi:hypothetical protein